MLLIRELSRVVRDLVSMAFFERRFALLLVVAFVALIMVLAATVTTVGPVLIYPLL